MQKFQKPTFCFRLSIALNIIQSTPSILQMILFLHLKFHKSSHTETKFKITGTLPDEKGSYILPVPCI